MAFSSNFSELLFFRFLCGLAHGGISAIITVVAMAIAPKNKHGTAVTATLVSLFAATCTIVPIFTFVSNMDVGHHLPALATLAMGKQN
ncbi:MFS transporter [bacterium]|nr:MFS transporter [bacterium]